MFEYLRRLATTGAAYTASSVLSKLIAVFLLPIYTHYLTPSDYGAAEVMLASVIAASIVVRLGIIEAILRFYYVAGEEPREDAEQEGQEAPQAGEPESDDSLLDIFKTEMAEDPEFEALVDGLEEIDMQELAQQTRELADHLRTLHRSGS